MTPKILIKDFPLPPSENVLYANSSRKGSRGRRKTAAYGDYEDRIFIWTLKNRRIISECKKCLNSWLSTPLSVIKIDFYFVFEKSRIIKKDGKIKKMRKDPLNYPKALSDCFSKLVFIDDSFFEAGAVTKAWTDKKSNERTILVFRPSAIRQDSDILTDLGD